MKKRMSTRLISAFLAVALVLGMIPCSTMTILADDTTSLVTYDDFDLLGSGYNLLGSEPLVSKNLTGKGYIFKNTFINYVEGERIDAAESSYSYTYVKDMNSYLKNQSNSMTTSISMGAKIKLFSLEAKVKMGITERSSSSSETVSEYAVLKANRTISTKSMKLQHLDMVDLWENGALATQFVEDAKNLGGSVTIEDFINRYGTHIVVAYSSGGGAMTTYSNETFSYCESYFEEKNTEVSLKADYGGLIGLETNIAGTNSQDSTEQQKNARESAYGYSYGAEELIEWSNQGGDFGSVNEFFGKINDTNSEILVDSSLELVPVWDLLFACQKASAVSDANTIVANAKALRDYFNTEIEKQCAEFYDDYLGEDYFFVDTSEEVEEWLSEEDLQIITTVEQFNDIRNDLDGVYILANNIDLTQYENWIPIGTIEHPFRGKLYGNYNTVSGLKITESTDNYAGLFGYVGDVASISNLKVSGTIALEEASSDVYMGGIAAYNRGEIKNCYDNVVYDVTYSSISDLNIPVREIDLSTSAAQTITIGDEIGVRLVGQKGEIYNGFNIVIADSGVESPAYIILKDVNIVGGSGNATICSNNDRPIYLISTGTSNSITGAENEIAVNIANSNVIILGDADLTIIGGKGSDGETYADVAASQKTQAPSGEDGHDGSVALFCNSLTVNLKDAPLYLYGGDGGNGGNGSSFTSRGDFGDMPKLSSGGNGGDGGNAGEAIITAENIETDIYIISCSSFYACPGNGGDGGDGGIGCHAHKDNDHYPDKGGNGGDGGNGGNGFFAGDGGDGGDGGYSYGTDFWDTKPKLGVSGDGGDGGNSGLPMSSYDGLKYYMGNPGEAGLGGEYGPTDSHSEKNHASYGDNGEDGSVTSPVYETTKEYGEVFVDGSNKIDFVIADAENILSGIQCGFTNIVQNIKAINNGCWQNNVVSIDSITKTEYYSGDTFERKTATILVDGKQIEGYYYVFNSYCPDDISTRTGYVKIVTDDGYGCERYIPVHITKTVPTSMKIAEVGKVEFVLGSAFEIDGLSLELCYNNGTVEYISEDTLGLTYESPSTENPGTKLVVLSYDYDNNPRTPDLFASYDIYVVAVSIDHIEITQYPDNLEYDQGESLDVSGIKVFKVMNDGTNEELDVSQLSFDVNPALCNVGTSTVTVTYAKKTATFNIEVQAKAGFDHAWDNGVITEAPSHTTYGVMTYTCTVEHCGATKTEEIDPISGHTYGDWYQFNGEVHQRICECGDTVERAHSWNDGEVLSEATHITEGTMRYTCLDCLYVKNEDIATTEDHSFGAWSKYDESQHVHSCECSEIEYEDHNWDEGTITEEPTYNTTGLMTYTCEDCDATKTEIVSELEISEDVPYMIVDSKNGVIGHSVTVQIRLHNNPGITSMRINVSYDSEVLTLTDVAYNTVMGGQGILPENIETLNGNIILYWTNGFANYDGDGLFATLTFNVSDDAVVDETTMISITYDEEDIYDYDEENVAFFCVDGIITFINYTSGDINSDGVLNSKDVTRLMRYLAGWDVEVNEAALDVNGDGVVNTKDTTRLMRYLANWDVEIH